MKLIGGLAILYFIIIMLLSPFIIVGIITYCALDNKKNKINKYKTIQQNNIKTTNTPIEKKQYLNYEYKKSKSSNTYIDIYKEKRENSSELKQNENPLLKKYLMTKSERIVFDKIRNNLSNKYVIFPQICMRSILSNNFMDRRNKSKWAIVDYLICTYPYYEPVLIVELDDKTHNEYHRKLKDIQLNNLIDRINLPIWRLRNIEDYSRFDIDISSQIDEMLKEYRINKTTIGY